MSTIYTLTDWLTTPPWEALINMINHQYVLGLDPNTTHIDNFTVVEGTLTEVTLSASRSSRTQNLLPPFTTQSFRYHRLNLSEHYPPGNISLSATGRRTSLDILQDVIEQTGVFMDIDDFLHEPLPWTGADGSIGQVPATYQLTASPWSLRWIGSLTVTLT